MDTNLKHRTSPDARSRVDTMFWRHWAMLVCVPLATTLVLASLLPAARVWMPEAWPWAGTERLLTGGLSVMTALFAWYVTIQQRRIMRLRDSLLLAEYSHNDTHRRHRARITTLSALSRAIGDENDPRRVFDTLIGLCKELFEGDRASLMLVNQRTQTLVVTAAVGIQDGEQLIGVEQKLGEGIAGWVALHRKPLLVGLDHKDPEIELRRHNSRVKSAMVVPLLVRDRVAGVLSVANDKSAIQYDEDDLATLQVFSETAEYCIRHAENADWMRGLIETLRDSRGATSALPEPVQVEECAAIQGRDESGYLTVDSREYEPLRR